jgi:broad specificity phosphatase PhoE
MKLFLVRHGTSQGNVNPRVYFEQNDCDIELTEKGKDDAAKAADRIYNIVTTSYNDDDIYLQKQIHRFNVVHSTYKRATQTCNILCDKLKEYTETTVEKITPSPLCREREWGSLRDILESRKHTKDHFNFYYKPTNGESFADTYQRAVIFHQNLITTSRYYNNIIVAHGEFNKVYLMYLLGWDVAEFEKWSNQKNGEVWVVENRKLSSLTPLSKSRFF